MKNYFVIAFLSITINSFSQTPNWEWARNSISLPANIGDAGIVSDSDGNVYAAGIYSATTISFSGVTLTNSEGYINSYIVKYDSLGNVLWAKNIEGVNDQAILDITIDDNNNIYITGNYNSPTISFDTTVLNNSGNTQQSDIFIVKLNANGVVIWAKTGGGSIATDGTRSIAVDNLGNVFVSGSFTTSATNFSGITLNNSSTTQYSDAFIAMYNSNGEIIWAKRIGGSLSEIASNLSIDSSGNLYVLGSFFSPSINFDSYTITNSNTNNTYDVFVLKCNTNGNAQWIKKIGGTSDETIRSSIVDLNGNLIVTGHYKSDMATFDSTTLTNSNSGTDDLYIAKYNPNGIVSWVKSAAGTGNDLGICLVNDSNNDIYLSGGFGSASLTFGNLPTINNTGSIDTFVTKYDTNGNALWCKPNGSYGYEIWTNSTIKNNVLYNSGIIFTTQLVLDSNTIQVANRNIMVAKMNLSNLNNENFEIQNYSVYPNPVNTILNLNTRDIDSLISYEISDLNGKKLIENKLIDKTIDVSSLQKGIYIINFSDNQSIKFIKE